MAGQFLNADESHGPFVQGPGHHSSILYRLLLVFATLYIPATSLFVLSLEACLW